MRACAAANVAALFAGKHLPFTDLPQHAAMIATLRHWWDPAWRFQEIFTLAWGQTQYLAYYVAGAALAVPLGSAELANAALLAAVGASLPYALRSLLRALGQDERLALFGAAFFWSQSLLIGFFNFVAALPFTLFGLALAVRQAERPTRGRAVGLAALGVALFYLHLSAVVFFVPAAALCLWWLPRPEAVEGRELLRALLARLPGLWRRLLWMAPLAALGLAWLATSPVVHPEAVGWSEPMALGFAKPVVALRRIPQALLDIWRGPQDSVALVALALSAALGLWAGAREPLDRWRRLLGAGLLGLALALYFAMPHSIGWLFVLNERYAVVAALLLPLSLRPGRTRRGAAALALAGAASLFTAANAAHQIRAFGAEVRGFDAVLARAQPARRLLALGYSDESRVAKFLPFHHFGAYYRARYGGVAEYSFADLPQSLVRYRPEQAPPPRPPGWEWEPTFRDDVDGPYYDYLLVRGPIDPFDAGAPGPRWRVVARDGPWALYEKVPPEAVGQP